MIDKQGFSEESIDWDTFFIKETNSFSYSPIIIGAKKSFMSYLVNGEGRVVKEIIIGNYVIYYWC